MKEADWYGIKVWHMASSNEIYERIEWCKKHNIKFITKSLRGFIFYVNGKDPIRITEEEIRKGIEENGEYEVTIGIRTFKFGEDSDGMEIGTAFFFDNKTNASHFKLVWV